MARHFLPGRLLAAGCLLATLTDWSASLTGQAAGPWSLRDAERLRDKVAAIESNGASFTTVALRTRVTENEVNAYLAYDARDQLPAGVVEPRIWILGSRRVMARAVVDLDAVRKAQKPGGWLDPVQYLSGRLPASVTGLLTAADGVARFELEKADIAGVQIPRILVQELLSYYSRTPEKPHGLSLDDPLPLPARIRAIEIGLAEAVIVQ